MIAGCIKRPNGFFLELLGSLKITIIGESNLFDQEILISKVYVL